MLAVVLVSVSIREWSLSPFITRTQESCVSEVCGEVDLAVVDVTEYVVLETVEVVVTEVSVFV